MLGDKPPMSSMGAAGLGDTGFEARTRFGLPTEIVVHESVTRSAASTVRVLRQKRLGVHYLITETGQIVECGDPRTDRLAHAGGHNGPSVAIEIVNPYYARDGVAPAPWRDVIRAKWAHHGRYVLPLPEQAEACAALIGWLTSPASGLPIPRHWIGLSTARARMAMRSVDGADARVPGVYAHGYFAHSDGWWPVLYAWTRLVAGLEPDAAYTAARNAAATAERGWATLPVAAGGAG